MRVSAPLERATLDVCNRALLLLLVCLGCGHTVAAKTTPTSVQDLQYGEVLFHYYQQDYFSSIVRLLTARAQSRLPHHADEAELLLGGLDLSYGLRDEAERIFTELLDTGGTREQVRNRAWYYLARVSWQRGEPLRSLQALDRIHGSMPESIAGEAINLHGLALLSTGRGDEAITLLRQAQDVNGWSPYLRYNLGVALIQAGRDSDGEAQLDGLGRGKADDREARLLRDKANLALGYSYLQNGAATASRRVLERVRLEGPLSNKALLGTGWADAEAGDYAHALIPWSELAQRAPTDPAVQESLLAIPYALNRMDLHGRAAERYEKAVALFQSERLRLDEAIAAVGRGELLKALASQDSGIQAQALPLTDPEEAPALYYLPELLSTNDFQTAVRNYRELTALETNLDAWSGSISAFHDMLAARKARFELHAPEAEKALNSETLESLTQHQTKLAGILGDIETSGDPLGLATPEESDRWKRLTEIGARIDRLPRSEQVNALRDRVRRLRGTLYWQTNAEYKARLWETKRRLVELDKLLVNARKSRSRLQETGVGVESGLEALGARITANKTTIGRLRVRTTQTRLAQGAVIERLAVAELQRRQERLDAYVVQARYALAQTYDSALNTRSSVDGGGQ